ncbi:MAG: hypothetical protein E7619_05915 [Ruminococcaceae bacterium]|nr:hypothetical protein [Oscillospiraceae bacterium]
MKRYVSFLLAVLTVLSFAFFFPSCSKLPSGHVKGDDIVVDNDIPFVYDESTVKSVRESNSLREHDIDGFVNNICPYLDEEITYREIAELYGNKVLRHYTEGDNDCYYTVYSMPDNSLFYLFCKLEDGEYYLDQRWGLGHNEVVDIRTDLTGCVYEQDTPSAILGDKLPSGCYLDYYSKETIAKRNYAVWRNYVYHCDKARIPSEPYLTDYYAELRNQENGKKVDGVIRCVEYVSFDIMDDKYAAHGAYFYDIYVFEDGTATLLFYHFKEMIARYELLQSEEILLSAEEVNGLKALFEKWDFSNIPTWNPEEFMGFDGCTTYVLAKGGSFGEEHLISMWESNERYGIYHISCAITDLVRSHVTVNEGAIFSK